MRLFLLFSSYYFVLNASSITFAVKSRTDMKKFSSIISHYRTIAYALFFVLAWIWAAWWMGDLYRMAYENSFLAADRTLMHFLWQESFGTMWIAGRALLLLYRWPLIGGLAVAVLLTAAVWLIGYCFRLRPRWRWLGLLPVSAWMTWVAWLGLNLFFQHEPGRTLGVLLLGVLVCAVDAFVIWTFKSRSSHHQHHEAAPVALSTLLLTLVMIVLCFGAPTLVTSLRHPYARPVTHMQVQMLHDDWVGMSETAHKYATLSYRPLAAYYAVALVHTGRLTDEMFDIRLDYDSLHVVNWTGEPDVGTNYYLVDCNYTAGLFRAAEHKAMEQMTMDGPSLFTLKHLTRLALLDNNWALARKYLRVLSKAPFEGAFIERYSAMLDSPDRVAADPEFALLRQTEPAMDNFESYYEAPVFLGYNCALLAGRTKTALMHSLMANLYSKRMPAFLERCQPLVGTMPPRYIAEGLVTQVKKYPEVLQAFPQLNMTAQLFSGFLRDVSTELKDRPTYARELFDRYHGYYPYYYFFGNLKATRKRTTNEHGGSNAGVN